MQIIIKLFFLCLYLLAILNASFAQIATNQSNFSLHNTSASDTTNKSNNSIINLQLLQKSQDVKPGKENAAPNQNKNKLEKLLPQRLAMKSMLRSLGLSGKNSFGFGPNIDISPLIPVYKSYLKQKIMNEFVGNADLVNIDIQPFDLNQKNQRLFMPYDQKYKIGDGFNAELGLPRSSPFYLPALLSSAPKSIEGQDGKVTTTIAISQEDLAEKLAIQAEMWGSGWGIEVKAEFSYSKQSTMSANEVVLLASHKIDLGKAFIDPSKFCLTQKAQQLLATNYDEFIKAYGTHFLAGTTTECAMNVIFRQKTTSSSSKMDIAASLEASYKSLCFSMSAKVSTDYSKQESSFNKKTEIEVSYAGANDDAFLKGLSIKDLQSAILEFPSHCTGNIAKYILWPYESAQSFVEVKTTIDLIIFQRKAKAKLIELQQQEKQLKQSKLEEQKQKAKIEKDYQNYIKKLEKEELQKKAEINKQVLEAQEYLQAITLLDEVFTAAILKNRIMRVGLGEEKVSTKQAEQMQYDDIFVLKSNELIINDQYEKYKTRLEALVKKKAPIQDQLKLIKEARTYLGGGFNQASSSPAKNGKPTGNKPAITKISQAKCQDKNCKKCNRYQTSECKECNSGYALTEKKTCTNRCPSGQYVGKISGLSKCIRCHPSCKECGKSPTQCTSCNRGYYLQLSNCVTSCKNGYYRKGSQCLVCPKTNNCKIYIKNKCECQNCPSKYFLKQGKCSSNCGNGYYLDKRLNKCFKCHQQCSQCTGKAINQCLKCKGNYVLQKTTCQKSCANGFQNKNKICTQCLKRPLCEIYTSNCGCTKCKSGSYMHNSKCLQNCPTHYYRVSGDRTCKKCGPNCAACSNSNYCTRCDSGFKRINGKCQRILTRCPSYYYLYNGECLRCNHNWSRCAGCVEVYWNDNYSERKVRKWRMCSPSSFSRNIFYRSTLGKWNDDICSIKVGSGTQMDAYSKKNAKGKHSIFTSDKPNLRGTTVGRNNIQSIKVSIKQVYK